MSGSFPGRLLVSIHSSVFAFVLRLESDEVIHAGLVTIVPANEIPCMGEGRRNQGAHQQADGKKCFHQNKVTIFRTIGTHLLEANQQEQITAIREQLE